MKDAGDTEHISSEELTRIFGRFMEQQVLERLVAQENIEEIICGQTRRVTCMFCDVCDFTPLAERTEPRELFSLLNRYFRQLIDIIFAHEGTVDKLIGDAIMVIFGAPTIQDDQEARAVRCAIEIQQKLASIRGEESTEAPLQMSVTINTGEVSTGCLGGERRMDYTVLGDAVNVAARMQDLAQPDQILIGEETHRSLPPHFEVRHIISAVVKGRSSSQDFYEVVFD